MKNSKKSSTIWVALITLPFVVLFFVAVLQIIVHFAISGSTGSNHGVLVSLVNIVSVLLGIIATVSLVGLPVWIIMLIKNK